MKGAVPNPATPRVLRPVETITDRAKRYRANANPPAGPNRCAFCAAARPRDIDHIDGDENNGDRSNLQRLCRSCNTRKAITQKRAGAGRRTRQFNPEPARRKNAIVPSFTEYVEAVLILRGDRRGNVQRAAKVLQAIPESKRWEYIERIREAGKVNPEHIPTFAQYGFATTIHDKKTHAHDEGGAIIHATPKRIRSLYAREIARRKRERRQEVPF